ncbi:MAG: CehA/McbA family metallohydrolase [Thermoleophilaceae bacterium]|nr:CehA/McbA family metallohydrolase [Thermoleophilaceae bacterium]
MDRLHDLSCVLHLHSTHSDGTGTVPEIARAAEQAGADVVLLTDHDTLAARRAGEEGWHGAALVLAGHEVSPPGRNHYLAFGLDEEIRHRGLTPAQIVAAVRERGGFGFAAHPFASGSGRFPRVSADMRWEDLECLDGLELWSFLADNGQRLNSIRDAVRFIARPERFVTHPPEHNLREWDRLGASRRVVGIGGLDAHQFGLRVAGRTLRAMSYRRSFEQLRTHVLVAAEPRGELDHDRELVYSALRTGRCYIAFNAIARATGFRFFAERFRGERLEMGGEAAGGGWTLHARLPRVADVRLLRDGEVVARAVTQALMHEAQGPGVYRVEVRLRSHGAERTWILSNPVYLR